MVICTTSVFDEWQCDGYRDSRLPRQLWTSNTVFVAITHFVPFSLRLHPIPRSSFVFDSSRLDSSLSALTCLVWFCLLLSPVQPIKNATSSAPASLFLFLRSALAVEPQQTIPNPFGFFFLGLRLPSREFASQTLRFSASLLRCFYVFLSSSSHKPRSILLLF